LASLLAIDDAVARARRAAEPPRPGAVVLVGNPNVGKSVLFGALTGTYVTVSNYPGTTVEVTSGTALVAGRKTRVVDTPGTASFLPASDDERVTRDILLTERVEAVVAVGDAKNLERALLLVLQLAEMGVPHLLCLNMMDEARERGICVDTAGLADRLGVAVVSTVAVRGEGVAGVLAGLERPSPGRAVVGYPLAIEHALAEVVPLLPGTAIAGRSLGLMVLAGDESLVASLRERMGPEDVARLEDARAGLRRETPGPVALAIAQARHAAAERTAAGLVARGSAAAGRSGLRTRLEVLTTHPVWGVPVLAAVLAACYLFVGVFGAKTLVDLLEQGVFARWISPTVAAFCARFVPWGFVRDLLVGPYGLVTMALAYSVALVLPIVGTFFVAFGVLEDSGYLPRLAVMVNRVFKSMGLNGKAVLPMVLGLGCDTMATLTTRILETPKERLIVILLLALGVPCSAQLTVILALFSGLPLTAVVVWLAVVLGGLFVVGRLAARVLPGRGSDFILELPPLRWPRLGNLAVKTVARIEWYLKEAVPFFLLGTLLLFVADRLRWLGALERAAEPLLARGLGLPRETAEAFVVGFLRRDFGAAGLYRLAGEGRLDGVQVVVAMVTITLFIPCVAQFFMMAKERGWRVALAIAAFSFPFALGTGALVNAVLSAFPLGLR
jgi:ferrous iron transport protein B